MNLQGIMGRNVKPALRAMTPGKIMKRFHICCLNGQVWCPPPQGQQGIRATHHTGQNGGDGGGGAGLGGRGLAHRHLCCAVSGWGGG